MSDAYLLKKWKLYNAATEHHYVEEWIIVEENELIFLGFCNLPHWFPESDD